MTEHEQTIIDLYRCMRAALDYCLVLVMERQRPQGNAEIIALDTAMAEDFGLWWTAFREKWDIPDHPFMEEILEQARKDIEGT